MSTEVAVKKVSESELSESLLSEFQYEVRWGTHQCTGPSLGARIRGID
jgi:hypothetical protein